MRKGDSVAIGADTLIKLKALRESATYVANSSKLVHVCQSIVAMTGHVSFGLLWEDYFSQEENQAVFDSPLHIYRAALKLHSALKDQYFVETYISDGDFESSRLQALIANEHGIFGLYQLRSVLEYTRFYSFGSGSEFALGAMHALYDTDASAETIARAGLAAGAEFDDSTSAPFDIEVVKLKQKETPPL